MTSSDRDALLDPVRRLYDASLREHGIGSKAVGWKDEESQRLRFEKLATVIAPTADAITVADLGCGYGAMFEYLVARLGARLARYEGVDINEDMVAAARQRQPDGRAIFVHGTQLPSRVDYSFVSGTFNVKLDASAHEWTAYVESTLLHLAERSACGFGFNLLSKYVDWRADHLYYGDPCHFFDFCRTRLSKSVTLLHDYPLYEWTIIVRL